MSSDLNPSPLDAGPRRTGWTAQVDDRIKDAVTHAWREPPAGATLRAISMTTGVLYICSAILCEVTCLLLPGYAGSRLFVTLLCVAGACIGLGVLRFGRHFPRFFYHLNAIYGVLAWSAFALAGGHTTHPTPLALPLLLIVANVPYLFSARAALAEIAFLEIVGTLVLVHIGAVRGEIVMIMGSFVCVALMALWLARLSDAAEEDPLTRVLNRRGFDRRLSEVLQRARQSGAGICLAILDFDNFKSINDTYGHEAGDNALRVCCARWVGLLPKEAVLARLGGDEFVLLMPGCTTEQATALSEQLRQSCPDGLSISLGVAEWDRRYSASDLKRHADTALYAAKRAGRDRVLVADEATEQEFATRRAASREMTPDRSSFSS